MKLLFFKHYVYKLITFRHLTSFYWLNLQKTPSSCEDEDTFGSLASASSHPNLSDATFVRPVPMEAFDTPAKKMPPTGDQLIGLPGYRRSAVYPKCEKHI